MSRLFLITTFILFCSFSHTQKVYRFGSVHEVSLYGKVKSYYYNMRGSSSRDSYAAEFDINGKPVSYTRYDLDDKLMDKVYYYNYDLFRGDVAKIFVTPTDSFVNSIKVDGRKIIVGANEEIIYELDEAGRIIRKKEYEVVSGARKLTKATFVKYSDKEKLLEERYINYYDASLSSFTVNTYDAGGRIVQSISDRCEKVTETIPIDSISCEYANGRLYKYENGKTIILSVTFQYNSQMKKLVARAPFDKQVRDSKGGLLENGNLDEKGAYSGSYLQTVYDAQGKIIAENGISEGKIVRTSKYTYDKNGNVVSRRQPDSSLWTYEYKFDKKNNWVLKTEYLNGKKFSETKRVISYYD